jgi:hypothetical protein
MADKTARKANTNHHDPDAFEESLRKGAYGSKQNYQEPKESSPDRVPAVRRNGPHGQSTNVDGSKFVTPLKKKETSGGNK